MDKSGHNFQLFFCMILLLIMIILDKLVNNFIVKFSNSYFEIHSSFWPQCIWPLIYLRNCDVIFWLIFSFRCFPPRFYFIKSSSDIFNNTSSDLKYLTLSWVFYHSRAFVSLICYTHWYNFLFLCFLFSRLLSLLFFFFLDSFVSANFLPPSVKWPGTSVCARTSFMGGPEDYREDSQNDCHI